MSGLNDSTTLPFPPVGFDAVAAAVVMRSFCRAEAHTDVAVLVDLITSGAAAGARRWADDEVCREEGVRWARLVLGPDASREDLYALARRRVVNIAVNDELARSPTAALEVPVSGPGLDTLADPDQPVVMAFTDSGITAALVTALPQAIGRTIPMFPLLAVGGVDGTLFDRPVRVSSAAAQAAIDAEAFLVVACPSREGSETGVYVSEPIPPVRDAAGLTAVALQVAENRLGGDPAQIISEFPAVEVARGP